MKEKAFRFIPIVIFIILLIFFIVPIQGFAQERSRKIDEFVQYYHELGQFNGTVLVAEGGKVILKKGYGLANMEWDIPNKPDTKFRIGSITKQFTSMLILQLTEQAKIDLQAKMTDYLTDYRKDTGDKVTIHHLLTHTSGIPSYTGRPSYIELPKFFAELSRDPYSVDEFVMKYCSGDLEFKPGSRFRYNNSAYFLLGAIIEKVTGKGYEEVLKEKILDPLGMKNTGYDHHNTIIKNRATGYSKTFDGYENSPYIDMSVPYAAGALYSTVEDLYLWDQALYTEKLLSNKMKKLLFKPHFNTMGGSYAYGWIISKKSFPQSKKQVTSISHAGGINGFNTWIERFVDDKHLIILFSNTFFFNYTPPPSLGAMSNGIINILYDEPYNLPKKSIAEVIYKTLNAKDVEAAIMEYQELKENHPKEFNFQPSELNGLGYHLLRKDRIEEAIEIFKLNVKVYPRYATGYDSLAEAYMKKGNKSLAITHYAKALELNPNNTNALEKLNELIKKK